jgi:hypothetical protein
MIDPNDKITDEERHEALAAEIAELQDAWRVTAGGLRQDEYDAARQRHDVHQLAIQGRESGEHDPAALYAERTESLAASYEYAEWLARGVDKNLEPAGGQPAYAAQAEFYAEARAELLLQAESFAHHNNGRQLHVGQQPDTPAELFLTPDQFRIPELDQEEERRRAGRGVGDMGNPADAHHALNIRPDVVASPAGLETITTMKSQHYDAAQEPAAQDLPDLTHEAIQQDPWNAVALPLPANADAALLDAAKSAASSCAEGEHGLMVAARAGEYTPPGWTGGEGEPDAHEENESRYLKAVDRLDLIAERQNPQDFHKLDVLQLWETGAEVYTQRDGQLYDVTIGVDEQGVTVTQDLAFPSKRQSVQFSFDAYQDAEAYPHQQGEGRAMPATPTLAIKQPDAESVMLGAPVDNHALDYVHFDIAREGGDFALTLGLHDDRIGVMFSKGAAGEIEHFYFDGGRAREQFDEQAASFEAEKANKLEDAFEAHIRDGATMSADSAAKLAALGMIDQNGNMAGHYFEHLDAGGFLDDARTAFYAAHAEHAQASIEPQAPAELSAGEVQQPAEVSTGKVDRVAEFLKGEQTEREAAKAALQELSESIGRDVTAEEAVDKPQDRGRGGGYSF